MGDVITATTPKSTAPTTFRSISGFALPSMHDNNAPIVSYLWNFINFRHRLAQYYWSSGWIIMIHQVTIFPNGSGLLPWNAFTFCGVPWVQEAAPLAGDLSQSRLPSLRRWVMRCCRGHVGTTGVGGSSKELKVLKTHNQLYIYIYVHIYT